MSGDWDLSSWEEDDEIQERLSHWTDSILDANRTKMLPVCVLPKPKRPAAVKLDLDNFDIPGLTTP